MAELTLEGLLKAGQSEFARNTANFLVVEVEVTGSAPEIIINPKTNFDTKLDYYKNAYREDLKQKNNPNIKIIHYEFVENLREYMRQYE
jgi:hypothetical protein